MSGLGKSSNVRSVPTAEVGVPETLKVDGSFCSDAYKTMQIFLGNVF